MIKNTFTKIAKFSFHQVTSLNVRKTIKDIRLDKSSNGDIPADILRRCDLCFQFLTNCINQSIVSGKFPDSLKLASISPVYKSKDPVDRTNYRPVSVLPLLSKIYERLIFDQSSRHANKPLSKLLCDFRKVHSTQYAIFRLLQSWSKGFENSEYVGTVLMNLSKAYDCIPDDLLIAKLEAYGLDKTSLHLLRDYHNNRKQRIKIGCNLSDWWDIIFGIPQRSILGPLLFNIFINDTLFFVSKSDINVKLFLDGNKIEKNQEVVLVGITIDGKLSFKMHIENICRKAKHKLHELNA